MKRLAVTQTPGRNHWSENPKRNNNNNNYNNNNMKVTIIPIVIGAFGTVSKGLLKGLEDLEVGGRVETI